MDPPCPRPAFSGSESTLGALCGWSRYPRVMSGQTDQRHTEGDSLAPVDVATVLGQVRRIARDVAVGAFVLGWIAFWSVVAWANYANTDVVGAVFTVVTLVVPAIALVIWYLSDRVTVPEAVPLGGGYTSN